MSEDQFVRVPSLLLESLLHLPLTGTQWRILLWTMRNTFGWDRSNTQFSWYRIAKELVMDRGGVVRAGRRLVEAGVLAIREDRLSLQTDPADWGQRQGPTDDANHRSMTTDSADWRHRKRGLATSVFRRATERGTEIKNKKESGRWPKRPDKSTAAASGYHPAGAAKPLPGKYDHVSRH